MAADEHMADPGVAHDVHNDVDGHGNGNGTGVIGADGTSTTATPIDSADGTAHDKQRPCPYRIDSVRVQPHPAHTRVTYSTLDDSLPTGTGFGITYHGIRRPVKTMC